MDGRVAAPAVTDGDWDDCAMLSRLTGTVPTGSGYLNVVRWARGRPDSFYKKYGLRNLVKSDFSSFQGRLRSHMHPVTPHM